MTGDVAERVAQLRGLAVFRHIPDVKLEALARILVVQVVPAGSVVFEEGTPGDALFVLARGRIRIEKRVGVGDFAELAILTSGDVFGEMALIEHLPRSARAVAHSAATLFVLEGAALKRWLASDPAMALGFVVEMLRVLSHRLRRSTRSVILLHDVGDLTSRGFDDEPTFLAAVLGRLVAHLDGEWSAAAYLYNEFNDAVARVATIGPRGTSLPDTWSIDTGSCSGLEAAVFSVALGGRGDTPAGFLVARNDLAMSTAEKSEAEVALAAVGHVVASALQNIKQGADERLRSRLHDQRVDDPPL